MPRQPSPVLLARQVRSARPAVPGKHARGRETVGGEGAGGRMQTHTTRRRAVVEAVGSGFPTRKSGTAADAGRPGPKGCRRAQLSWDSDAKKAVFLGLAGAPAGTRQVVGLKQAVDGRARARSKRHRARALQRLAQRARSERRGLARLAARIAACSSDRLAVLLQRAHAWHHRSNGRTLLLQ